MQQVGQRIGPDAELGLVAWKEQNLLMADRAATTFGFNRRWDNQLRDGVEWQMQAPAQRWLLVQEDALLGCVDRDSATLAGVANRRRWWLVRASDIRGPCTATAAEQKRERELHRIDGDE